MRVFISGAAGFLGSHLCDAFLLRGDEVVGIDNLIGGYRDNVPDGVQFAEVDCNNLDAVRSLMAGCDVVYHTAALAYEGLSVFSPHVVTTSIVGATAAMVSAACANRVKRFVYLSSMARYGTNTIPFREDMDPRPQDPYGIGKLAAEQLVRNLCDVHGVEWSIAVPHNLYGPRSKYDDPFRNVASIFANIMLQGRQPFIYGDGMQRRCFSYVSDAVTPLVRMGLDERAVSQIVNIGPDDEFITVKALARAIGGIIDVATFEPTYMPGRPQEVRDANCSADKARHLLGYAPRVPLYTGLRELVAWIRLRGPRPFDYHLPIEIQNDQTPRTWADRLM